MKLAYDKKRYEEHYEKLGQPVGPLFMQWDEVAKLHGFEVPLEPYTIAQEEHVKFIRAKHEEGLTDDEIARSLGWAHDTGWVETAWNPVAAMKAKKAMQARMDAAEAADPGGVDRLLEKADKALERAS